MIPFVNLTAQRNFLRKELEEAEARILNSGNYIGGSEVQNFEKELSLYTGMANSITCASGTDAIELALNALGLRPGDEVIIPDFSFISPAECVYRLGAIPRFADILPDTFLLDPADLMPLITPKTKGIIAVHLFGQTAAMEILHSIAKSHDLWLLGDAAQSFGAKRNNKHCESLANITITSFYPTKPLGAYGDGGALFTNDDILAEKIRKLANHGSKSRYFHELNGKNSRLDALQAAILRVKLEHFDEELKKRQKNAEIYNQFFSQFPDLTIPYIDPENTSTYAQYTLRAKDRNKWLSICDSAEIPTGIYYPRPLSKQPCFMNIERQMKNSGASRACHEVFSLPVCAYTNVEEIIQKIKSVL